jgi:high-affinity iron transporter
LFDTYQSRLSETLLSLPAAQSNGFAIRRAESAALAEGYFYILTPAYVEQRGINEQQRAFEAFTLLNKASFKGDDLTSALNAVEVALEDFRAAPLSPAEQSRCAGQLRLFI